MNGTRFVVPYAPGVFFRRRGPDRHHWVIRPEDLLVFDVERVNLRIEPGEGNRPAQLVREGRGPAYLILTLPPQNLAEVAYFTTVPDYPITPGDPDASTSIEPPDAPPIDCLIAGWSRLVFIVPDERLPIEWTADGLLKAVRELELNVPANALPPRDPSRWRSPLRDIIAKATVAALSPAAAPTGGNALIVGPSEIGTMVEESALSLSQARRSLRTIGHALQLTETTGSASQRFTDIATAGWDVGLLPGLFRPVPRQPSAIQTALELPFRLILSPNRYGAWFHSEAAATSEETGHTELWHTRLGTHPPNDDPVEGEHPLRTVRAVWATDPLSPPATVDGQVDGVPDHDPKHPFRMSLDGADRHNVVHLSSNFGLTDIGGRGFYEPPPVSVNFLALTSLGGWLDSRGVWDDQPSGLSVEEWRHRATLGRDHYVRVVYAGRLFPLGHRASLVKITERQFHDDKSGNPAYLRQRMFIIVREHLRTYRESGLVYEDIDEARAGERFDLKLPFTAIRITTVVSPLLDRPEDSGVGGLGQDCFWPFVGGQPFQFHAVATDTAGQSIDLAIPLIFIDQAKGDDPWAQSIIPHDVTTDYATRMWPGSAQLLATAPIQGQRLAFAKPQTPDDTTFAVRTLTFAGEVPIEKTYDKMNKREPRYVPVMRRSQIDVPAIQQIAQTSDPAGVVFAPAYLSDEFAGKNAGQVFLAADPEAAPFGVKFSDRADRSGGLVAPDMSMAGLSRITGPVSGDLETASGGSFNPEKWFGPILSAQLFGVLKLKDILGDSTFDKLGELPQFLGGSFDQVQRLVKDLERLRRQIQVDPVAQTGSAAFLLDQLVDPASGSIPALFHGGSAGAVAGQLSALHGELATLPAALAGSSLDAGPRAVISEAASSLEQSIGALLAEPSLLQRFADGDHLPQAHSARFEWRPNVASWGPFKPKAGTNRNLILSVEAVGEAFTVTCSLDQFDLDLEVLILHFERVQFRSRAGKKPEIDVKFIDFEFAGPLSFVETLRNLIPIEGFADPPEVKVTSEGITAGFSMGLPSIAIGVFSLENLSLAAGFTIPFVGPPMSTFFRFCERENPSRLTVMMFGGGFFFGVTVNADGLQIAEGAIEFGAAISVNFGVASGSVSAMAGLYFKFEPSGVTLAGYFRLRGEVEALGIVSVSIELYLEMRYESGSGKCVGTATISIEIEVALFSTTISISCTKKFAGAGADPILAEMFDVAADATSQDWNDYCAAFAA